MSVTDMNVIREYRLEDAERIKACIIELQDFWKQFDQQIADGRTVADEYFEFLNSLRSWVKPADRTENHRVS